MRPDELEEAQRRSYAEWRDRVIEEARRDGIRRLTLPLQHGGEETIDLRLH